MTEPEVDAIFAGYPSERRQQDKKMDNDGFALDRPGVFEKSFSLRLGGAEHNYYISVYFDKDGRVVLKRLGKYSS